MLLRVRPLPQQRPIGGGRGRGKRTIVPDLMTTKNTFGAGRWRKRRGTEGGGRRGGAQDRKTERRRRRKGKFISKDEKYVVYFVT